MLQTSTQPPLTYAAPARRRPSLDFSITGLVYCSMMMFMGLAAINSQANLLFGVFGLMIGILLVSGVVSRKVIRRVDVRRVLPDHGIVGRPLTLVYQLANRKRFWPSLSVTVTEMDGTAGFTRPPQAYLLHAAPGMTAAVPTEVVPARRGLHVFDRYQLSTSFPFGFIKRAVGDSHRDHLLVYPPLGKVDDALLELCRPAEKFGPSMRPRPGGTDEFYGVREHRPGDNPRLIHWRRSARTAPLGVLVAKELTQVAPPRLLLLVDTSAGADRTTDRHARIERSIAMAASLAARALDADLPVGLFVWSNGWKGIEPSRGKRHRNDLLSVLARLPLNRDNGAGELLARCHRLLKSGTTAVLLTPDDRPFGREERGRQSMVVIPAASQSAADAFRFDKGIDFAACIPADQQPKIESAAGTLPRQLNARFFILLTLIVLCTAMVALLLVNRWIRGH